MTVTLLTGGEVLTPAGWARQDLLLAGGSIVGAGSIPAPTGVPVEVVDRSGSRIVPGLVDGHLHVLGGGGGGGWSTRIPELPWDAVLEAGITTVVGMPGVDPVGKSVEALLARTYAFEERGVRARAMLGGFHWPAPSLTGDVVRDLYTVPALVGVKIAVGEHLATAPDAVEGARLLTQLHWLAGITGKAALLHAHLGLGDGGTVLEAALDRAPGTAARLQVTHANYAPHVLEQAVRLGLRGARIDVNPLINPDRILGAIAPADAIARLLTAGVPLARMSLSTDGNASVPRVLPDGGLETFSHQLGLLDAVRGIVAAGVLELADALALVTVNPAAALRMEPLGRIQPGAPADLLVLDDDLGVRDVYTAGVLRVRDGRALDPSPFRDPRSDHRHVEDPA